MPTKQPRPKYYCYRFVFHCLWPPRFPANAPIRMSWFRTKLGENLQKGVRPPPHPKHRVWEGIPRRSKVENKTYLFTNNKRTLPNTRKEKKKPVQCCGGCHASLADSRDPARRRTSQVRSRAGPVSSGEGKKERTKEKGKKKNSAESSKGKKKGSYQLGLRQ